MERYWIDHCIGIARDAGNVDAAQDATKELDAALARAEAAEARLASAINTLQDIAAMGKKAGSESARHRLMELGVDVPDYGSMT